MKILASLVFAIFLGILGGCATSSSNYTFGRDFPSENVNRIVKGKTNTADLVALFGQPFSKNVISQDEERCVYTYQNGTSTAHGSVVSMKVESTGHQKSLDVLIKSSSVTNYTYNEGDGPTSTVGPTFTK